MLGSLFYRTFVHTIMSPPAPEVILGTRKSPGAWSPGPGKNADFGHQSVHRAQQATLREKKRAQESQNVMLLISAIMTKTGHVRKFVL